MGASSQSIRPGGNYLKIDLLKEIVVSSLTDTERHIGNKAVYLNALVVPILKAGNANP